MPESSVTRMPELQGCASQPGQLPIRAGGANPGWHFFLGELADLGESVKPLDLFRCEKCGRLEFYDLDFSLPRR